VWHFAQGWPSAMVGGIIPAIHAQPGVRAGKIRSRPRGVEGVLVDFFLPSTVLGAGAVAAAVLACVKRGNRRLCSFQDLPHG
jgi:hypothetical protein